jgi:hypothetical protein
LVTIEFTSKSEVWAVAGGRLLRVPATKAPAISIEYWGFLLGGRVDPNSIVDLTGRLKSPRNDAHSRTVGSFFGARAMSRVNCRPLKLD